MKELEQPMPAFRTTFVSEGCLKGKLHKMYGSTTSGKVVFSSINNESMGLYARNMSLLSMATGPVLYAGNQYVYAFSGDNVYIWIKGSTEFYIWNTLNTDNCDLLKVTTDNGELCGHTIPMVMRVFAATELCPEINILEVSNAIAAAATPHADTIGVFHPGIHKHELKDARCNPYTWLENNDKNTRDSHGGYHFIGRPDDGDNGAVQISDSNGVVWHTMTHGKATHGERYGDTLASAAGWLCVMAPNWTNPAGEVVGKMLCYELDKLDKLLAGETVTYADGSTGVLEPPVEV